MIKLTEDYYYDVYQSKVEEFLEAGKDEAEADEMAKEYTEWLKGKNETEYYLYYYGRI